MMPDEASSAVRPYRHPSISTTHTKALANPEVTYAIAKELFGFTGWPSDWAVGLPKRPTDESVVTLEQQLKEENQ